MSPSSFSAGASLLVGAVRAFNGPIGRARPLGVTEDCETVVKRRETEVNADVFDASNSITSKLVDVMVVWAIVLQIPLVPLETIVFLHLMGTLLKVFEGSSKTKIRSNNFSEASFLW
jgi:hypothetical protein